MWNGLRFDSEFPIRCFVSSQNFKGIAKILGQALDERPDLHLDVMAALRNLVTKHVETGIVVKFGSGPFPMMLAVHCFLFKRFGSSGGGKVCKELCSTSVPAVHP